MGSTLSGAVGGQRRFLSREMIRSRSVFGKITLQFGGWMGTRGREEADSWGREWA